MSTRTSPRGLLTGRSLLPLELAVTALLAATAFGFVRLFATTSVVVPLVTTVLGAQAVHVFGRRLRLPTVLVGVVSLATLVVVVSNWVAAETTVRFLPTRATGPAVLEVARTGIEAFEESRAPVPAETPFVLGAVVALWVATFLTDWAAVRLRLAFETVVPSAGLFVFCAVLGSGRHQLSSTLAFGAGVALFAVVHRTVNSQRATWLAVERDRGVRTVAASGVALAAVAVLVGVVIGPRLPGAQDDELWTWRGRGDGTRVVVSPFVTIESRLVDQADTELFRVTATEPAYWRTAGLDVYRDGVWQIRGRFSRQSGSLPGDLPGARRVDLVEQRFELSGLAEIWLPAAYAPSRIIDADGPVTWNEGTSTLSVDRDRAVNTGATYTIESSLPRYTAEELRAADPGVPASIAADFLAVPDDVSPAVTAMAAQVTAGQPTRYDQLRALQDWFLTDFSYSTQLGPRRGDPLEQFLAERVGFCQQFAGTFAVMARTLGAPARVAVGFTWGDPDPEDPSTLVVTGRHAHAWPEVWFAGLGWVPFEPTPGRGAPDSEAWTGVPANQDGPTDEEAAAELPESTVDPTPGSELTPEQMFPEEFLEGMGGGEGGSAGSDDVAGLIDSTPTPVLAGMGLVASWFIGVPLIDALSRYRRRAQARTAPERVQLAWTRATDELAALGLRRHDAETRLEFSHRVGTDRRVRSDAPVALAELATTARFHPAGVDPAAATAAEDRLGELTELLHRRTPGWKRYLRQVDPRNRLRRFAP